MRLQGEHCPSILGLWRLSGTNSNSTLTREEFKYSPWALLASITISSLQQFNLAIEMPTSSYNLYEYYVPSNAAAIAVAVVFLILILLHAWKVISTRQWFAVTGIVGGICESSISVHMAWKFSN